MSAPNFVIIGAQKCGTSWLHRNLSKHVQVYMPPEPYKELFYFSMKYDKGWKWYTDFFRDAGEAIAIGEATPNYTAGKHSATVAERMHHKLPDARLIYVVRHPVERLRSGYSQLLASGAQLPPFRTALKTYSPIIETSRYWDRLNDFRAFFPDTQIYCLFLEDIKRDPQQELLKCFDFLGVEPAIPDGFVGTAVNRRANLRADRWKVVAKLRRSRVYGLVKPSIPRSLIKTAKPLYQQQLRTDTAWDAESLEWAKDTLFADSQQFLEYCGKPRDYWQWN